MFRKVANVTSVAEGGNVDDEAAMQIVLAKTLVRLLDVLNRDQFDLTMLLRHISCMPPMGFQRATVGQHRYTVTCAPNTFANFTITPRPP